MCVRLVQGIVNFIRASRIRKTVWWHIDTLHENDWLIIENYPAEKKKGPQPKFPRGTIFDCPACREGHLSTHPSHTRNHEPPGLCRYYDKEAGTYTCPSCLSKSPFVRQADHPGHTFDENCRHHDWLRRTKVEGRRRRAGPHRDPAVPPAGEPLREVVSSLDDGQNDLEIGVSGGSGIADASGITHRSHSQQRNTNH